MSSTPTNTTILKFGYPESVVREYTHWIILLRPSQVTLGSLVLAAKGEFRSLPELPPEAFRELQDVTREMEVALTEAFAFDRINYLLLMMVDPHVHFHVIPRYSRTINFAGAAFEDSGWPGHPSLLSTSEVDPAVMTAIRERLRAHFQVGK